MANNLSRSHADGIKHFSCVATSRRSQVVLLLSDLLDPNVQNLLFAPVSSTGNFSYPPSSHLDRLNIPVATTNFPLPWPYKPCFSLASGIAQVDIILILMGLLQCLCCNGPTAGLVYTS
jgi:hypothetical protein